MIKVPVSIPNKFFRNPSGIKLLTRLKLCFSHLHEQKFRQNFRDTLNPICNCWENIETTTHYLFHCPNCLNERMSLLSNLQNLVENILANFQRYCFSVILHLTKQKKHRYFKCYCSIYICWYLKTWCLSNITFSFTYTYIYIYIYMKCHPGYHCNGFVATHALGHMTSS